MALLPLVLGLDLPFWSVMVIAGVLGIVAGYTNIFVVSWLQGNIGTDFRGSVMSVLVLGTTGLAPISLAVSGFLVQLGFPTLFVSAGVTLSPDLSRRDNRTQPGVSTPGRDKKAVPP